MPMILRRWKNNPRFAGRINIPLVVSWPVVLATVLLFPAFASAIVPAGEGPATKNGQGPIRSPELAVHPSLTRFERGDPRALAKPGLERFFSLHSDAWEVLWDERSDRPNLIQGRGIALLPGRGNDFAAGEPRAFSPRTDPAQRCGAEGPWLHRRAS